MLNKPPAAPPLPKSPDPVWAAFRTHSLALVYLLPSIFITFFARDYLRPRVTQIWQEAGLNSSKAKWLMDSVDATIPYLIFSVVGFVVFVVTAELAWASWRRYRKFVVTFFMLLVHTAVLTWITAMAICATLAGPMLAQKKVKELKATMEPGSSNSPQSQMR